MERETDRIGYPEMLRQGPGPDGAPADGRRLLHDPDAARGRHPRPSAWRSAAAYVHVAIGYPGLKFLPDLQRLPRELPRLRQRRQRLRAARAHLRAAAAAAGHRGDPRRRHRRLARAAAADRRPGRGSGLQTQIVHVFRTYVTGSHGPNICACAARAATAGPTRASTTRSRCGAASSRPRCASSKARSGPTLYKLMGGTNTPKRRRWQAQMQAGPRRRAGTAPLPGEVDDDASPARQRHRQVQLKTATGPVAGAGRLSSSTAPGWRPTSASTGCSPTCSTTAGRAATRCGRLDVERNFEVLGTRSEPGTLYASGTRHPGRLLPRRRHLPRAADRRAGDRRRPGAAGLLQDARPGAVDRTSGGSGSAAERI